MVFLSLPLYKGQTITKLADNGRKGFRAFCAMVLEVSNGQQWSKKEVRNKNGRKMAEKLFALYAPFPYYYLAMM